MFCGPLKTSGQMTRAYCLALGIISQWLCNEIADYDLLWLTRERSQFTRGHALLCIKCLRYRGSWRERRHASNDAHASKVEKCFVLLFRTLFFFTIVSFKNKKSNIFCVYYFYKMCFITRQLKPGHAHKWSAIVGPESSL